MTTGERIKEARKTAGVTQAELADKLGIPYQSVSQWERDTRKPKLDTLQRIATVLRIPVPQILGEPSWVHENLRFYRDIDNISCCTLSAETGIPVSTIKAYENPSSVQYVTEEHLQKIADYFQVPCKQILGHSVTYEWMVKSLQENNMLPLGPAGATASNPIPSEFNEFEQFIETLGYRTTLDEGNYRLQKGKASVVITPDQMRGLVRASRATVAALVQDLMETATPGQNGSEGPQEGE